MTYTDEQRALAAAWKTHTTDLPAGARPDAPWVDHRGHQIGSYPYCLPAAFAEHNLLADVRTGAQALFTELGIPWHAGIGDGPGNHLLSSQVQCVNALFPMVGQPARIAAAFGSVVDVGEVLEIEPGRFLTFEYIGPTDFFGEARSRERVRGSRCTSVDAAFLHRAAAGHTELVLVEWKFTESYDRRRDERKDAERQRRYFGAFGGPSGPVRPDVLAFEHLLDEPFYQLMRQQLLAHALEVAGVADRVRVVHVLSPDNDAYQRSLVRPEHRALGATVSEVWRRLLARPDRYDALDPAVFLDPDVTSAEYVERYAPDVVRDEADLLASLGAEHADEVGDVLDWEGDVEMDQDGVHLRVGSTAVGLGFPFRVAELRDLAAELETNP